MQVERVTLVQGDGHRRVQRWRVDGVPYHSEAYVTVGTLPDGRWWAARTGMGISADAGDEQTVRALAAGWMSGGSVWVETPANFDAGARPVPAQGWVWHGGHWLREDR